MAKRGTPLLPNKRLPIGAMLEEIVRDEKINLESGDVLLFRTGWLVRRDKPAWSSE
jgi:hypothetical protein